MTPEYTKTLKDEAATIYYVEVVYQSFDLQTGKLRKDGSESDWGRYAHTAFNDKRCPSKRQFFSSTVGNFDAQNKDVSNHKSRVNFGGAASDRMMAFYDHDAAQAYADRLRSYGEMAHKQNEGARYAALWAKAPPLQVRVVEEKTTKVVRLCASHPTYEWPIQKVAS